MRKLTLAKRLYEYANQQQQRKEANALVHFEPSMGALSLRSDAISSMNIIPLGCPRGMILIDQQQQRKEANALVRLTLSDKKCL